MSGQIEVGCWAIVAYATPCCGIPFDGPRTPFKVTAIGPMRALLCPMCSTVYLTRGVKGLWPDGDNVGIDVLKRVDDLPPEESTETEREVATT
jgi:hypothetical protein